MPKSVFTCLALLFLVSTCFSSSAAQQPEAPAVETPKENAADTPSAEDISSQKRRHPWGRFSPGAWSLVRVVNETFDNGIMVSKGTREIRTTLLKVEDDGVTLQLETSAWVSGTQLDAEPQTVKQCFHGGLCGMDVKVSQQSPVKITIDGQDIECKVESAQWVDGNLRASIRTYYSDTISPFVFKRESETVNLEKKTTVSQMTIEVDALDMPCELPDEICSAAHFRIIKEQASGARTITLAYMSPEIPGGTICHSSKEVDPNGRVISRSILELTDFGMEPEKKKIGILKRLKPARSPKSRHR